MTTWFWRVVVAVWSLGVGAAFAAVWHYKLTPGSHRAAPATWPRDSLIQRGDGVADIVMFVHPECPCTRASMTELERLAVLVGARAQLHVVIVDSIDSIDARGTILERARALPGVDLIVDRNSVEAQRFAATTSGTTRVYARDGSLLFEGGLTLARGHEGGPVAERIRDLVMTDQRARGAAPTFGCALANNRTEAQP